ncbi:MAG TPA: ABC transporter substrate-binding protein [Candidatus Fimivivens sp.]|nr:ABC transporter substrate-binding protein [Candidatus Fimivivens sp.]
MKKTVVGIIVVVAMAAVGYFVYPKPKQVQVSEQITIAQAFEVFLYAPLYVAQEQGFFKDQGLDVNIITAGGDEKAFAALLSGDAQFAVGDPTFAAVSGERGQPGKVVAAVLRGVPFWGVAKNPSIGVISSSTGLKGYRVATYPSPSTAYALQKEMFQSANLQPKIAETAFGSLLASVDAGKADIALELEPNVSIAVKNGDHVVYSLNDYYPEFAITGVTALPGYVGQNPETVQKVTNALQKAMDYIRQHPNEAADFLSVRFPEVPKDIARNAVENMIKAGVFPEDTVVTRSGWDAAIQTRLEVGDLRSEATYENYVDARFSERAK